MSNNCELKQPVKTKSPWITMKKQFKTSDSIDVPNSKNKRSNNISPTISPWSSSPLLSSPSSVISLSPPITITNSTNNKWLSYQKNNHLSKKRESWPSEKQLKLSKKKLSSSFSASSSYNYFRKEKEYSNCIPLRLFIKNDKQVYEKKTWANNNDKSFTSFIDIMNAEKQNKLNRKNSDISCWGFDITNNNNIISLHDIQLQEQKRKIFEIEERTLNIKNKHMKY